MVIDTSVLVSLLRGERNAERLHAAILADPTRLVSAATVLEAALVLLGERGPGSDDELDALLLELDVEVVPVTTEQTARARLAARLFGRGRHAARLNVGDLFSYALAMEQREPLLFVGDDFSRTDVAIAAW
jgi:ribonuclease VapC